MDLRPVSIVGAGAVGCYFGGMLARAGVPVTLIGRPPHMNAIAEDGLLLESLHGTWRVRPAVATTLDAVRESGLVLVAVKTLDTESVAREIQPLLAPGAAVVCMQNGVDNAARMREAAGIPAIPCVVYVGAFMAGPGHVKHTGRGDLVFPEEAAAVGSLFESAGVPCRISPSIQTDLWKKMVMNCAYNAISALGRAQYGNMARDPRIRALIRAVIIETVDVARAEGVDLSAEELLSAALTLGESLNSAMSSTAQDIARGKKTEIDSLNGYVARRGAAAGIATPLSETLCALVHLLEAAG